MSKCNLENILLNMSNRPTGRVYTVYGRLEAAKFTPVCLLPHWKKQIEGT